MAHVVCKELGFEVWPTLRLCDGLVHGYIVVLQVIEMNASDARSKRTLEEHLETLLGNTTMTQFYGEKTRRKQVCFFPSCSDLHQAVIKLNLNHTHVGCYHGRS
jgi:hypothetical protein